MKLCTNMLSHKPWSVITKWSWVHKCTNIVSMIPNIPSKCTIINYKTWKSLCQFLIHMVTTFQLTTHEQLLYINHNSEHHHGGKNSSNVALNGLEKCCHHHRGCQATKDSWIILHTSRDTSHACEIIWPSCKPCATFEEIFKSP